MVYRTEDLLNSLFVHCLKVKAGNVTKACENNKTKKIVALQPITNVQSDRYCAPSTFEFCRGMKPPP